MSCSKDFRLTLFGVPLDNLSMDEALDAAEAIVDAGEPSYMVSLNVDILKLLHIDESFRAIYSEGSLLLMDSDPLLRIARRKGIALKGKVSGSDLMPKLCERAARRGMSCFILGGAPGVPERAADALKRSYPALKVTGTLSPDYGFERDDADSRKVAGLVKTAAPDILFVCLGTPKSEKFIARWMNEYDVPLSLSVGAAVDFVSGNVKRAPRWMSDLSLEWLFRITQDPRRLIVRYASDAAFLLPLLLKNSGNSRVYEEVQ